MPKKKTVGAEALELQTKKDEKIDPIELQRAVHEGNSSEDSFEHQVFLALQKGRASFDKDFYVVVLFKKERLLHNVVRQYFFPRISCPTPEYDQVVYKYHRERDELEFLWVVPDKQSCKELPLNGHLLPLDQQDLVQYAKDFNDGTLDKKCALLNGELIA